MLAMKASHSAWLPPVGRGVPLVWLSEVQVAVPTEPGSMMRVPLAILSLMSLSKSVTPPVKPLRLS